MSKVIDFKYLNLFKIIKMNCAITSFNLACSGAVLYLLLGVFALPLWASVLKLATYIADLYRCKLQEKLADNNIGFLNSRYMFIQYIETAITIFAYVTLLYYLKIGLLMILLSNILNAISRAYFVAYSTLIDDLITCRKANNRTAFYAQLDTVANTASIIGTMINAAIYYLASMIHIKEIDVYYFFCCFYAFTKIIDLFCSIVEKIEVDKMIIYSKE